MDFAIQTQNLGRIFKIRGGKKTEPGQLVALQGVNLQIRPGELFGLLGPNGAGKTTLIKIFTTLLAPSSGKAWVAGYDVTQAPQKIRFSGAIFPLEVLPAFLRPVGLINPITYWLELIRRTLSGSVAQAFPTLSGLSNLQLFGILIVLTAGFAVLSYFTFRWCESRARELGLIDVVTNY